MYNLIKCFLLVSLIGCPKKEKNELEIRTYENIGVDILDDEELEDLPEALDGDEEENENN